MENLEVIFIIGFILYCFYGIYYALEYTSIMNIKDVYVRIICGIITMFGWPIIVISRRIF